MKVSIRYFAVLKDQRGLSVENYLTSAVTVADLYEELRSKHGFTLARDHLRVAINAEFAPWDTVIGESDAIAFIPPVAGG